MASAIRPTTDSSRTTECPICHENVARSQDLALHQELHTRVDWRFKCKICGLCQGNQTVLLKAHMRDYHGGMYTAGEIQRLYQESVGEVLNTKYLLAAANQGLMALLNWYVEGGVDVNKTSTEGMTALHLAAAQGHDDVVRKLLGQHNIKINQADLSGRTPLSRAAEGGHYTTVQLLLAHPDIAVYQQDRTGRTPLMWAVRGGKVPVVQLLMARPGATPNHGDESNLTIVEVAIRRGEAAVVSLLLEREPPQEQHLFSAVRRGHLTIVKYLMERGAQANWIDVLTTAAEFGREEVLDFLLQTREVARLPELYAIKGLCLEQALASGQMGVINMLIQKYDIRPSSGSLGRSGVSGTVEPISRQGVELGLVAEVDNRTLEPTFLLDSDLHSLLAEQISRLKM